MINRLPNSSQKYSNLGSQNSLKLNSKSNSNLYMSISNSYQTKQNFLERKFNGIFGNSNKFDSVQIQKIDSSRNFGMAMTL